MGSPNPPRKHHYVPQLLLRRFCAPDKTLWTYDLDKGLIYPASPETAGYTRDLYSRESKAGTSDHAHIENLLAQRIDGPGDLTIRELLAQAPLASLGSKWNDFLIFVAAQVQRTPANFARMETLIQPLMQSMLNRMGRSSARFEEGVRRNARARGLSDASTEEALAAVREGKYKLTPTKDFVISMSLAMIQGIFDELRPMGWQIATLDESEPDLIIGDHPVLTVVPMGEPVGFRHPEINVKLPLSTRVAAIGNWSIESGYVTYATFHAGAADRINEETMRQAKRFLFASYESQELLAKAKSLHGTGPKVHVACGEKGEGLAFVHQDGVT